MTQFPPSLIERLKKFFALIDFLKINIQVNNFLIIL